MLLKQLLLCQLIYQFLLLVKVNGSSEDKPKSLYPFSKAQLVDKLDQQEMDKRLDSAKHWNEKLEQILNNHKNNLKSFFSANGKLKSREEILREAFIDAIKNKNLMDLIELLVTATAEEKETFKELNLCEQLKKSFKKDLKLILFALCANQRETAFDLSKELKEIKKDQETLTHLTSPKFDKHHLIPMLTTKSYPYLREVFAKENNSVRTYFSWYSDQSKFYKVIYYIVKDAVDGRPEFYSQLLFDSLKVLYNKSRPNDDRNKKFFFVNYANAHKVFQRILATRAQIDLADIVTEALRSFGFAIGTLRGIQKSYNKNDKKLFGAYIEILKAVRDHEGITESAEKYIQFDPIHWTASHSGGGPLFSGVGSDLTALGFAAGLASGGKK